MIRKIIFTKRFKRDFKRSVKQGKNDKNCSMWLRYWQMMFNWLPNIEIMHCRANLLTVASVI